MPTFPHVTCSNGPNGDLFVNYMDYTDDAGMVMFTNGQVNRVQASLDGDRPTIGHAKPGPTLAFADVHPTLTILDVHPTFATIDVHPTAAIADLHPTLSIIDVKPTFAVLDAGPTLAISDVSPTLTTLDQGPTLAFRDVQPTIAVLDQGPGTIAVLDQGPGTIAVLDQGPGTIAVIDQGPGTIAALDLGPTFGGADQPNVDPSQVGDPGPMPFALATPHHTNAWIASHRGLRDQQVQSLAAQAQQIEQALKQYADAEAQGTLSTTEAATAEQLHAEYQRLMTELEGLGAFGG
jgi:hypothetical protein